MSLDGWLLLVALAPGALNLLLWAPRAFGVILLALLATVGFIFWQIITDTDERQARRLCQYR
jgi:hypothetical protein